MRYKSSTFACIAALFSVSCSSYELEDFPKTTISNGLITASVATETHRKDNFYQGQRFDWSGIVYDLHCGGHSYFGKWFEGIDPEFHDNISGPVNEFGQIGYDDAAVGGEFLKIGVGVLKKDNASPYNFRANYKIVDGGRWECSYGANWISYQQTVNSKIASYQYKKTIELVPGKPTMKIRHSLKNTGTTKIDTTVYCHNFFMLDSEPAGKNIEMLFAYNPSGAEVLADSREFSEAVGNKIAFKDTLPPEKFVLYRGFDGGNKIENYDFTLKNKKTGAAVRITCDKPLLKATFWSCTDTYCIEPFNKIEISPGEEFSWTTVYRFSSGQIQ